MDPRITTAARLQQQKSFPSAEQIYRQVLQTAPTNVDALLLLGLLLHETSRHDQSVETLQRALQLQPQRPDLHQTLIGPLLALGRLPEAISSARELARLRPMVAEMQHAAARLLLQLPDPVTALPYARRATELSPRSAPMFLTLSRVYQKSDLVPEALNAIDRALAIDRNFADAIIDKATLRQSQGHIDEAIGLYESGLKLAPKNVAALNNLGSCYLLKTRSGDALRCFEAAAELWPTSPKPRNNIGAVLKELGQIDQAIQQFQKALQIDPTYADGFCNLGAAYATIGEHAQAIASCREALRIQPTYAGVRSNLLLTLLSPTKISPQEIFDEHVAWDRSHAGSFQRASSSRTVQVSSGRRIRIGYVSADFREHSVRYFMEPILSAHDRSRFEIVLYASGRRRDEVTDRFVALVDACHFVAELTDQQLAAQIEMHQIDILIDLAGHTSDNRLMTFARRPATVQATYLGYPATTGLSAIDYRLTDAICDPQGTDAFHTEKLIRLPHAFFAYTDDPNASFDPSLPSDRNGHFTFGSFNSFTKMNDATLETWAAILRAVPGSRLFMKARPLENPSTRHRVLKVFADQGIAPDRLDLRSWVSLSEHSLLLSSAVDLMLDTFPYNGHTTSCQALWRGVPMVTLQGVAFRSRVGSCILQNLDLPDFIAQSRSEYERIAVRLATDPTPLRELRPQLRERMQASPLCDGAGFTRSLESAYLQMLTGQNNPKNA